MDRYLLVRPNKRVPDLMNPNKETDIRLSQTAWTVDVDMAVDESAEAPGLTACRGPTQSPTTNTTTVYRRQYVVFVKPPLTPPTPRLRRLLATRFGKTVRLRCRFKSKSNWRVSVPQVGRTCPSKTMNQEQYVAPKCHWSLLILTSIFDNVTGLC